MTTVAERFIADLEDRFARVPQYDAIKLTSVATTSTGAPEMAYGSINGEGNFPVKIRGNAVGVGDLVWARRTSTGPVAAEYEYTLLLASDNPGGGFLLVDANIPYPLFDGAPLTGVDPSGGSITSYILIKFLQLDEKYRPSGYQISWKPTTSTQWKDEHATHIVGQVQGVFRISGLLPGTQIDVKLSTEVNWAQRTSPPSPTSTFTASGDTASPGNISTLNVDLTTPGQIVVKPVATIDPIYFDYFEYSVATSAAGSGAAIYTSGSILSYSAPAGTAIYVACRIKAKNGTYGNRVPASPTSWQGPYVILDYAPPLDTVAPPVWNPPTLTANIVQPAIGGEEYWLTVTLPTSPAYAFPSDYDYTLVRIAGSGFYDEKHVSQASGFIKARVVAAVLLSVTLQGVDKLGNGSATSTPVTITIQPTGAPTGTPTVTTQSVGLAVLVQWSIVTSALAYEVQRATDNLGTGATTFATTDAQMALDLLQGTTLIQPTYWYRVRAKNLLGTGPYSGWVSGTVGVVDAQNLRLNSVTALQIVGDQAFFNKVLTGNLVANVLRTATSGQRWEMDNTGAGQIRLYNASGVLTMYLDGNALNFLNGAYYRMIYSSSGATWYQDTDNVRRAEILGSGLSIYRDDGVTSRASLLGTGLTIWNNAHTNTFIVSDSGTGLFVSIGNNRVFWEDHEEIFAYHAGGHYQDFFISSGGNRFRTQRNSDTEMGITPNTTGLKVNFGSASVQANQLILVSPNGNLSGYNAYMALTAGLGAGAGSTLSAEAWSAPTLSNTMYQRLRPYRGPAGAVADWRDARWRWSTDVDNLATDLGYLELGARTYAGFWGLGTAAHGATLWYDETTGQVVANRGRARVAHQSGTGYLDIDHLGTSGSAYLGWTEGALYLGWFQNPANQVIVGNGSSGYGPILASAFTVSSGRQNKEAIRAWTRKGALASGLRAARFRRKGEDREMVGFIAEEVEAHLPEAVVTVKARHPNPDRTPGPETEEKFIDPLALLAELWEEVRALRAEVATLKGAAA